MVVLGRMPVEAGEAEAVAGDPATGNERIVLATDGSAPGLAAMRWLAVRAGERPLEVQIAVVADPSAVVSPEHVAWQAREYLDALVPGTRLTIALLQGDPRPALVAGASSADLLVLGTNRSAQVSALSVVRLSTRLAESAPCPTVLVPLGWAPHPGPVVVGVRDHEADGAALAFAVGEADRSHRDLVVLHIGHLPRVLSREAPGWDTSDIGPSSGRLEETVVAVREAHPGLTVRAVLEEDPAAALREVGRGAALVVMGSDRLTGLQRVAEGSAQAAFLELPLCPVAVVPSVPREG